MECSFGLAMFVQGLMSLAAVALVVSLAAVLVLGMLKVLDWVLAKVNHMYDSRHRKSTPHAKPGEHPRCSCCGHRSSN